ncbi:YiiX/YebB-like N1pC/P60 family cysteine hydrolase [Parabacteroides sp. PF5-9]|uniref:YiiX/YebB-like N1pC/P60 family cysteine hydrolase n=1 Tax=Parabacteroides sp. PF5-9 TaxID=1742404 RepID=UPI002473C786|nr:YiiX/YebB-like N1pC/P60 family cysteine hydrolase [Parabacteroides sp. PF5-9]MDH6356527.1 hypothetical protein [Parabacteroides sp. PF5-9]
MKYYMAIILLSLFVDSRAEVFQLKNGDLIFQEACTGDTENTIKQVTSSIGTYQFTHVGIVYIDSAGAVFVLEATTPKVTLTPISEYLYPDDEGCFPKSVVGRLKEEYQPLIPHALAIGLSFIGKEYDYGFILNNDAFYCSELVYEILKQANKGKEVFRLNEMTFKSPDTEETTVGWIDYFHKHNLPIPEGEAGINPGAMSRADVIEGVYEL